MTVHQCRSCNTVASITDELPNCLKQLQACDPIGMDTPAERRGLHTKVPRQGIYGFYEDCVAVYVGRSNKISDRVLQHSQPGASHKSTPVATKIANEEMAQPFDVALRIAKEVVKTMKVRAVEIQCPNVQAIFEIYAHVALGYTRYNDFDNR